MDPAFPPLENLVVDQLRRHVDLLPAFEGIAIDRFDYSEFYSYLADDGLSWVGGRAARSLRESYKHTFARLGALLHDNATAGSKLMLGNCNSVCRVDLMRDFDGLFNEGAALNAVAFLGLAGSPTILWTYSLTGHSVHELNQYFQQHLLMRVFPMAPMPKNDHSIQPGNATIDGFYEAYAPLFDAVRGMRWLLLAAPATVAPGDGMPLVNVFTSVAGDGGTVLVSLMLAGPGVEAASLTVAHRIPGKAYAVDALYPGGGGKWQPVAASVRAGEDGSIDVGTTALRDGCALVRVAEVA